ncbi:MAG: NIPSNAP family protein [Alphaproteobacteria bacterium]
MILEQRTYTLHPGNLAAFWQMQVDRGFDIIRPVMERALGTYVTVEGTADQIIHLFRYDDLNDWQARLRSQYGMPELQPYFAKVRPTVARQVNAFWLPAPVDAAVPLWSGGRDWLPGDAPVAALGDHPNLVIEQETLSLRPGKLPQFWPLLEAEGMVALAPLDAGLIGCFYAMIGVQHQVVWYRWAESVEALRDRRRKAASGRAAARYNKALREMYTDHETKILAPAPVAAMVPLFVEAAIKGRTAPARRTAKRR